MSASSTSSRSLVFFDILPDPAAGLEHGMWYQACVRTRDTNHVNRLDLPCNVSGLERDHSDYNAKICEYFSFLFRSFTVWFPIYL